MLNNFRMPTTEEYTQAFGVDDLYKTSYSSISKYICDNYEWFESKVLKSKSWKDKRSTIIGSAVHEGIEAHRRAIKEGNPLSKEDVIAFTALRFDEIVKKSRETNGIEEQVTKTEEWCREEAIVTITGYLDLNLQYKPVAVELGGIFSFMDFEGVEMPLYLDTRIDLIHEDEKGDYHIKDHKTVTKWYEKVPWKKYHNADMQAGAYYIGCMALTGKAPKTCTLDQVVKWELKAYSWYNQAQLKELCAKNWLEIATKKYVKNVDMEEALVERGIIEMPKAERLIPYVIDYEEDNMRAVRVFVQSYKYFMLDSYIKQTLGIGFMPNENKLFGDADEYENWLIDNGLVGAKA
jgi:hypothetical protein